MTDKQKKRPNILLLFPDQHRGDWMPYNKEVFGQFGMDELPINMPNIKKLMENGVTFTNAVTSSPLCAPARACLASGLRYDKCGVANNNYDYDINKKTFYSVLKESGYNVGGVGKFDLHKATMWWGLDGWIDDLDVMGFTHAIDNAGKIDAIISGENKPKDPYMKYLYDNGWEKLHLEDMKNRKNKTEPTKLPEEAYCDNWIGKNAVEMIRNFSGNKPWFMQVNFTGPHNPWDVTETMRKRWSEVSFNLPNKWNGCEDNINEIYQNYAAMLENIDRNIGMILDEIRNRAEFDNTIVIYTSDHGEMLGDFGKFSKGKPERGSVHIPLVISKNDGSKNVYSNALAETQDLAATIVEYAGADMPEALDAISLVSVVDGSMKDEKIRKYQVSALNDWKMIADGNYKLIVKKDRLPELFDIVNDPWENINIAESHLDLVNELMEKM